jgi:hypothetical protein
MRKIMIMVEYLGTKISLKTEKELGNRKKSTTIGWSNHYTLIVNDL